MGCVDIDVFLDRPRIITGNAGMRFGAMPASRLHYVLVKASLRGRDELPTQAKHIRIQW